MRRFRGLLCVFTLFIGSTFAQLFIAAWAEAGQVAVVTTDVLNMRSGPGLGYGIVGKAYRSERLSILSSANGWYKVNRSGVTGWISADFARIEGTVARSGGASQVAVVTGPAVNLRSGPGTNFSIAGKASQGDRLTVLAKQGDWLKVKTNTGLTAWVAGWLVNVKTVAPPAPAGGAAGQVAVVTNSWANLRSGPGTNFSIAGKASQGDRLTVLAKQGDWLKVKTNAGLTAWIAGWLVKVQAAAPPLSGTGSGTQPPAPAQNEVAVVTGGQVNIRSGPNTSYALVTMVARGTRLPILGKSGSWYKVALSSGQQGYVRNDLVRIENAGTQDGGGNPSLPPVGGTSPGTGSGPPASSNPSSGTNSSLIGKMAQVTVPVIDIRSGAGTASSSIASASKGSSLPITGVWGDWLQVRTPGGATGWVKLSEVTIIGTSQPSRSDEFQGDNITIKTEVSENRTRVIIQAPTAMEYALFTLRNPYRVVVDIAGIPEGELPGDITLNSPVLTGVRTGWQDGGTKVRVVSDLVDSLATTRYKTKLSPDQRSLVIEFWRTSGALADRTVVLDAGHGGRDPGAIGATGLQEKDVNLAIVLEAARLLEQEGINVVLTRSTDEYVELDRRPVIANDHGADVFVSVHCNSNYSSSYNGTSTYYSAQNVSGETGERQRLASAVQDEMVRVLGLKDGGVRTAGFVVTKYTNMPSCLVEVAFISNPSEEALLSTESFRNNAAQAIVRGIITYLAN
ncbi:MAG: SH3 domain-containing protein [Bacillota bacterium]